MEMKKNNIEYQSEENREEERKKKLYRKKNESECRGIEDQLRGGGARESAWEDGKKGKAMNERTPNKLELWSSRREFVGNEIECERFPIS